MGAVLYRLRESPWGYGDVSAFGRENVSERAPWKHLERDTPTEGTVRAQALGQGGFKEQHGGQCG